jgi:UDPglucose 6-dehydrogenase
MDAVGADSRIGKAFLNAGRGYGGGCFPKDVSGLIASGLEFGETLPILEAAQSVNGSMPGYIIEKLRDEMGDDLADKQIAVLGLSFKAGTSDVRRSPSIVLANILADAGAKVSAFDPQALEEARADTDPRVALKTSVSSAIKGAEAVIIATDWPEFLLITPSDFAKEMKGKVFVDAMNRFDPKSIKSAGLKYIGVGRS